MKRIAIVMLTALLAGGCGIYGKYSRPEFSNITAVDSLSTLSWREMFTDTCLQALIDTALVNNTDLNVALFKVREAEAVLTQSRLGYLPSASVDISASPEWSVKPAAKASWELDIFGKNTNAVKAAKASLQGQKDYAQAVRTLMIAQLADCYYSLLLLDRQLAISEETLLSWAKSVKVQESLKAAGKAKDIAVQQSKAKKLGLEASALGIRKSIQDLEMEICSIMGVPFRHIPRGSLENQTFPSLSSVPVCCLASRPDVHQAEMKLAQAFYMTNYARSSFYPSLTLSLSAGWALAGGEAVANPSAFIWSALAGLAQPVFSGGRLTSELKKAEYQQEEAKLQFRQALLDAGQEINSALAQCRTADEKLSIHMRQTEALQNTADKIELLMIYSNANYLEVLSAQQALLDAQMLLENDRYDKIQGLISLYHAVGGGVR